MRSDAVGAFFRRQIEYRAFRQQWNIGLIHQDQPTVAGLNGAAAQEAALRSVQWAPEKKNRFFADPFLQQNPDGSLAVLCEDFDWATGVGEISLIPYRQDRFGEPESLFRSGFHLSYPFVYEHFPEKGFVPEHSAARDLSFFRIDEQNLLAAKVPVWEDVAIVDPTFLHHGGKHWLFCTHAGSRTNQDLHIYHADDLLGPWTAHSGNPVKSDPYGSRPAGQFFSFRGSTFRVGQDCVRRYGEKIVVYRLGALSSDEFVEEEASIIAPLEDWLYDYGLHTMSHASGVTAIDASRAASRVPLGGALLRRFIT